MVFEDAKNKNIQDIEHVQGDQNQNRDTNDDYRFFGDKRGHPDKQSDGHIDHRDIRYQRGADKHFA
jgi:hypothetical protein